MRQTLRQTLIATTTALALGVGLGPPSRAMDIEQTERLTYAAMLGGLHIADLMVTLDQSQTGYTTNLDVVSRGVVRWVQSFRASVTGHGDFAPTQLDDGVQTLLPEPKKFHREWTGGEIASLMTMTFDPDTRKAIVAAERLYNPLTDEDLSREDMPWYRPGRDQQREPVPEDLRLGVLDPMGAFIAARHQLLAQEGAVEKPRRFSVPIFDGRRRYDIVGETAAPRTVNINDEDVSVIPVSVELKPVHGFNERSLERVSGTDSRLYFSADGRFIPIQFIMASDFFAVVINLEADCKVNALPCETFGEEPT